jgi:hypothetical protein
MVIAIPILFTPEYANAGLELLWFAFRINIENG